MEKDNERSEEKENKKRKKRRGKRIQEKAKIKKGRGNQSCYDLPQSVCPFPVFSPFSSFFFGFASTRWYPIIPTSTSTSPYLFRRRLLVCLCSVS